MNSVDPGGVLSRLRTWLVRVVNGLGGLEPLLDLCGFSFRKKIRVRVAILRDPGTPLGMTATPSAVQGPLDELQNILWNEAHVTLDDSGGGRVRVLEDRAPDFALRVRCGSGGRGRADEYFKNHLWRRRTDRFGYGVPLTVFIVNEVVGDWRGGPCTSRGSYVVLDRGLLEKGNRVLAHRVAHLCGLPHLGEDDNLMAPKRHGRALRSWQKAMLRNSPHVTHF